ncbi:MAG TPA: hypothetical protein VM032_08245 [Vicinamibacterales bacterium]|nr:hypothetical protein [Vicinamibacterales bacterium]
MSTAVEQLAQARTELNNRCNMVEEAYEFMLAYAGQGLSSDAGSAKGSQVREYLTKAETALSGLSTFVAAFPESVDGQSLATYTAFFKVIDADARAARAAVALVLAQPSISSQVIDNLNASIHLRALLTDLFLVDEVLK